MNSLVAAPACGFSLLGIETREPALKPTAPGRGGPGAVCRVTTMTHTGAGSYSLQNPASSFPCRGGVSGGLMLRRILVAARAGNWPERNRKAAAAPSCGISHYVTLHLLEPCPRAKVAEVVNVCFHLAVRKLAERKLRCRREGDPSASPPDGPLRAVRFVALSVTRKARSLQLLHNRVQRLFRRAHEFLRKRGQRTLGHVEQLQKCRFLGIHVEDSGQDLFPFV